MGGHGSGRWHAHWKKRTVDECLALRIGRLKQQGLLEGDPTATGTWHWSSTRTGKVIASMRYEMNRFDLWDAWVRLTYTTTRDQASVDYDYKIQLQTTCPHFGGLRWWFTCPLKGRSGPCNRRVRILYLPDGGRYFGCRRCHDLTYESCLLSNNRDIVALARDFDTTPGRVLEILSGR